MRLSTIKRKLANGQPAFVTTLHLTDASLFELTSLMGFDGIWLDLEHHNVSLETAAHMMRAARVGASDIIARPAKGEFMRMARLLEAGATGIMYPRCADADEAAQVVRWAKFAPMGERGVDGANPDMPYCTMPVAEYLRLANEQTFIIIQIEQPEAVDNADAIAAVEGVDILLVGPGDLSILSGVPGQYEHPLIQKAMQRVADAAARHGKHWGTIAFNPEHARRLMDMGAKLICHDADILMIKRGLERLRENFEPLGFTFDDRLRLPAGSSVHG